MRKVNQEITYSKSEYILDNRPRFEGLAGKH